MLYGLLCIKQARIVFQMRLKETIEVGGGEFYFFGKLHIYSRYKQGQKICKLNNRFSIFSSGSFFPILISKGVATFRYDSHRENPLT